jgi:hypothetical protein
VRTYNLQAAAERLARDDPQGSTAVADSTAMTLLQDAGGMLMQSSQWLGRPDLNVQASWRAFAYEPDMAAAAPFRPFDGFGPGGKGLGCFMALCCIALHHIEHG